MKKTNKFCYDYPRPSVTTDCVLFARTEDDLKVLLIERKFEPYKGKWAFPGGFLNMDEDIETGAKRELYEETGLQNVELQQLHTFGDIGRDPRGRVISVVYFAVIELDNHKAKAGDDAEKAEWFSVKNLPELAFDHSKILDFALNKI